MYFMHGSQAVVENLEKPWAIISAPGREVIIQIIEAIISSSQQAQRMEH